VNIETVDGAAIPGVSAPSRILWMDLARGLAVAGMIVVHLVPTDGLTSRYGPAAKAITIGLEGTSAALFFILIGIAWSIQADRARSNRHLIWYTARRSLALLVIGVVMHRLVWSTEVLSPFAVMMAPSLVIRRLGRRAMIVTVVMLLAAAPIFASIFGSVFENDWLENGSHLADTTIGWVTLRYLLFDGNYPVIPWLVFPILGIILMENGRLSARRMRLWFVSSIAVGIATWMLTVWTESSSDRMGEVAKYLYSTWIPTSVPFMVLHGGLATSVISGIFLWESRGGLSGFGSVLACVGRASLTHYLAHILLIIVALRTIYPGEDWPLLVGVAGALLYLAAAAPVSMLWFRFHKRGPLEELLARASGKMS